MKRAKVIGLFLVACAMLCLEGCEEKKNAVEADVPKEPLDVSLGWSSKDEHEEAQNDFAFVAIDISEAPLNRSDKIIPGAKATIEGAEYYGIDVYVGQGHKDLDLAARVLRVINRKVVNGGNGDYLDIYVSGKWKVKLRVTELYPRLVDVATGKALTEPYLLEPGTYHLHALRPK